MNEHTEQIRAIAEFITAHADEPLSLASLAREAGMSPYHLQRTFAAVMGVSPKAFHAAARVKTFKARLRAGESVATATYDAGYGSASRVQAVVDGGLGMTPRAYRARGAGETIVYAVRSSPLGELLMAATGRGVCAVDFGDDARALVDRLHAEFPRADISAAGSDADVPLDAWMAALAAHLATGAPYAELPLDLRGTALQVRVWRFLLSVKPGDVVSYSEIAAGIGAPRAVRAVANACAANRLAVLVPCHRALRADGELGGYRWGLERKRALLDAERSRSRGLSR